MKALLTLMYDYSEPGYLYCQVENLGQAGKNRKNPLANPKKLEPGSPAMPGTQNKSAAWGLRIPAKAAYGFMSRSRSERSARGFSGASGSTAKP